MGTLSVRKSEVKPSAWQVLTDVLAGDLVYKDSYPEGVGAFTIGPPHFFILPSGSFMGDPPGIVDGDYLWAYDPSGPFSSYRIKEVNGEMSLRLYDPATQSGEVAQAGAWISGSDAYVASGVRTTMLAGTSYLISPPNATKCCMHITNSDGADASVKVEVYGYPRLAGDGVLLKVETFTSLSAQDSDGNYTSAAASFDLRGCHYIDFTITSITVGTNLIKAMFF